MELKQIESLLKSYELGQTSIKEEAQLRAFFNSTDVPDDLEHYRILFEYFSAAKQQTFHPNLPKKASYFNLRTLSIAASIALLFGLFIKSSDSVHTEAKTYSEQDIRTYNQAKSALEFLSLNLNKGTQSQMNALNTVSNTIKKGQQNFVLLSNFNKTTNKIFNLNP